MEVNVDSMIHLDMQVFNCRAEFLLNDIPVRCLDSSRQPFITIVAHRYLITGKNKLKMVVLPNAKPSSSLDPHTVMDVPEDAMAAVRLVQYPLGGTPGELDGAELFSELSWAQKEQEGDEVTMHPIVKEVEFEIPKIFDRWEWQGCRQIDWNGERTDILAFAESLYAMFREGRGAELTEKAATYLADYGKSIPAYGEDNYRNDLIQSVNRVPQKAGALPEFDPEALDLRLVGDGRMVQMLKKNWAPNLSVPPQADGYTYALDFFVGKLSGGYAIVF